jgi:hypothetical protein
MALVGGDVVWGVGILAADRRLRGGLAGAGLGAGVLPCRAGRASCDLTVGYEYRQPWIVVGALECGNRMSWRRNSNRFKHSVEPSSNVRDAVAELPAESDIEMAFPWEVAAPPHVSITPGRCVAPGAVTKPLYRRFGISQRLHLGDSAKWRDEGKYEVAIADGLHVGE